MISHIHILNTILEERIVAVIRLKDETAAERIVEAIAEGGIRAIEITLTTPGALGLIRNLAGRNGLLVGVGSVMERTQARAAFEAGALFYASPITDEATIGTARDYGRVAMPGAFTPTEIMRAAGYGADIVKLFPTPADGLAYLKSLRGPMPEVRIAPSGGVTPANAAGFIRAGAAAINIGTWLTTGPDGREYDRGTIRSRAEEITAAVRSA